MTFVSSPDYHILLNPIKGCKPPNIENSKNFIVQPQSQHSQIHDQSSTLNPNTIFGRAASKQIASRNHDRELGDNKYSPPRTVVSGMRSRYTQRKHVSLNQSPQMKIQVSKAFNYNQSNQYSPNNALNMDHHQGFIQDSIDSNNKTLKQLIRTIECQYTVDTEGNEQSQVCSKKQGYYYKELLLKCKERKSLKKVLYRVKGQGTLNSSTDQQKAMMAVQSQSFDKTRNSSSQWQNLTKQFENNINNLLNSQKASFEENQQQYKRLYLQSRIEKQRVQKRQQKYQNQSQMLNSLPDTTSNEQPSYRKTLMNLITFNDTTKYPDCQALEMEEGLIVRKCVIKEQIKQNRQYSPLKEIEEQQKQIPLRRPQLKFHFIKNSNLNQSSGFKIDIMWFVIEACGIVCAIITYLTVFTVQVGFIRLGIWEDILSGSIWAWLHLAVFSFNCTMIYASHFKCMTTEPGILPRDYEELDSSKLPQELSQALSQIKAQLLKEDDEDEQIKDEEISATETTSNGVQDTSAEEKDDYQIDMKTVTLQSNKAAKKKQEEQDTYKSIMKKVNTSSQVQQDDEQIMISQVAVNAKNVRFLDRILSKKCKKCNSIKPPHSHHCSICKRCIGRMDHHCPWVNNCVGFYTQKHFILFLVYVFLGSMHALYLIARNSIYCLDKNCALFQSPGNVILACISMFLALLFGLFVCIMFCDKISCIVNNTSTIDKLQKVDNSAENRVKKRTSWQQIDQVFSGGKGFSVQWFIPCDILGQDQSSLNSKLQRLQLSEELEKALQDEFGRTDDDPLLSSKFDINEYINSQFPDEESLKNVDTKVAEFDEEIQLLDNQIKECIREQAYASEIAREELRTINEESAYLVDRISSVKEKAEISEEMVKSICSEIRNLDLAKKNITFSITSLKRIIMLITGIEQLRQFCIKKQYREAAHLIEATDELCNYFKDYKDISQIADLKKERDHLCNQLRMQILEDFNMIEKGSLPDLLYEGCFAIDAMGEKAVNEVRNWFCGFILEPYKRLFAPGQPDAAFENTKRRFAWLRRTLKEFQEKYEHIFPREWNLKPMIAYEFCRQTKLHIDNILSTQHHQIDVSIIIDILQHTIDFEHDLHKRFTHNQNVQADDLPSHQVSIDNQGNVKIEGGSKEEITAKYKGMGDTQDKQNKKVFERIQGKTKMSAHIYRFKGCISECFEPYLKSYSESEERKIIEAIETVMSQGDKLEKIDYVVYSSSLHLFKNIKSSFKRCLSFSTSKALFDLHISFKNAFRHYSKLLRKLVPLKLGNEYEKIALTDEQEIKCVYIINTCEYCLETIPGLHNQIVEKVDQQYQQKIDLNVTQDTFRELINVCISGIVTSIEAKSEQLYANAMHKQNWANFSGVQDTSTFIKNISSLVQKRIRAIKGELNSVYFNYLLNKISTQLPNQFLQQVYKIKKVNDESSQQFLLDLVDMKTTLMSLPILQPENQPVSQQGKVPESYSNFVNKNILKIESRFKVLGYPVEQIKDAYSTLVKDKTQDDLENILTIRGVKKSDFAQYKLN